MLSIQKIGAFGRTYRHINRYRQILQILIKYGFGDLVSRLKIEQYLELGLKVIHRRRQQQIEKLTRAERIRMALIELGPTFIKMGQMLSTRPDLIPIDLVKELAQLQDRVPPFPFEEVTEIIVRETRGPLEASFQFIDPKPIAAASIAQVHHAILPDGSQVVIKVQRPRIHQRIEIDLEILLHLSSLMEHHVQEAQIHRPTEIIEEFARAIEKEVNFLIEAAHIERFARQFRNDPAIHVPMVYRSLTTTHLLTMELIKGIKSSEVEQLKAQGYDLDLIAARAADLILRQIFTFGFFHSDPHPGNVFVLADNVICYLDFGQMGRISRQERHDFTNLLINMVGRDEKKAVDALLRVTHYREEPDRGTLEEDLSDFIDEFLYLSLKDLEMGKFVQHLMEKLTSHKLTLKPNLFLMTKALATVEGVGLVLKPDFKFLDHVTPFLKRIRLERLKPLSLLQDFWGSALESLNLLREIPNQTESILRQMREGKVKIQFEHRNLEQLVHTLDRVSNRISFAIVVAALIVGSSLMFHANMPPHWRGMPLIGLIGFLVAGIFGLWLLVLILKSGKMK